MPEIENSQDAILDKLLEQSKGDFDSLAPLLARFADVAAQSKFDLLTTYAEPIQNVCIAWEEEYVESKGVRLLCKALANYYFTKFHEVNEPCEAALQILKSSSLIDLYGLANMVYGANHRSLGELDVAVEHLMTGGELINQTGDLAIYKSYCFYQLAEINVYIKDYEAAEKNYNKTVAIAETLDNKTGLFRAYNGISNLFLAQNKLTDCKKYLELSLSINGLSGSQKSRSYCDLGIYYHTKEEYTKAKIELEKSYRLRIEGSLRDAASTSLIHLSKTLIELDENSEALEYLEEALAIAIEFQSKSKMQQCYHLLANLYKKEKKWQKSAELFAKYDELQIEQNTKQLQNIYKLKNEQINKQKLLIEEFYDEMRDSIRYAKRIQTAILPPDKMVSDCLHDSFVLYKPKDIVAGDFYWVSKVNDMVLFAAADCTGHGVPGAMVSVICNNALNRSVREYKLSDPGEILDKTREIVIQEFEKSEDDVKDGMDIALCSIEGKELKYAGAHNPLWIVREGEIIETKANKQPIGNFDHSQPFTTHTFKLEKGDSVYIFSDGYVDQFGGPKGKKFKAKALKEILKSIQELSLEEQKKILNDKFENWKGDTEQVDDVCVIGVRI